MSKLSENQELFKKERLVMEKLLANNPNYFGTALGLDPKEFQVVQPIQYNTAYEELTCVGLWPEKNLLTATLEVKLPFGFLSGLCAPGSHEYVRFFIDWDDDGDFSDANEDLGIASVNVHDIPEVKKHHLCYAVPRSFKPFLATCKDPYIVRLRAILSWNLVPPPGVWNFIPIWGNVLDCWVQVDPVAGKILGIVSQEAVSDGKATKKKKNEESHAGSKPTPIEAERSQFLELIQKVSVRSDHVAESRKAREPWCIPPEERSTKEARDGDRQKRGDIEIIGKAALVGVGCAGGGVGMAT